MKTEQQERMGKKVPTKDKKSIQVEEKLKKDVKEKKPEAKAPERLKTKEIKAAEVTSPKAKGKKETALAVREKIDHKDQFAFCRYMIDMFAHGNLYTGSYPPLFLKQIPAIPAVLPAAEVGKLNVTATKKVEKGKKVVREKKAIPQVIRKEEERKKVTAEKKGIPEIKKKEVGEEKKRIHEKKDVSDTQAKGKKEEKRKTPERTILSVVKKADTKEAISIKDLKKPAKTPASPKPVSVKVAAPDWSKKGAHVKESAKVPKKHVHVKKSEPDKKEKSIEIAKLPKKAVYANKTGKT
ncbi:triadin-like isoform X2 [Protobothrops mucrosquamatus]|nr:triadin-like isoform X2 [Protobothrops mucrosquamatus]